MTDRKFRFSLFQTALKKRKSKVVKAPGRVWRRFAFSLLQGDINIPPVEKAEKAKFAPPDRHPAIGPRVLPEPPMKAGRGKELDC